MFGAQEIRKNLSVWRGHSWQKEQLAQRHRGMLQEQQVAPLGCCSRVGGMCPLLANREQSRGVCV